jgi:timeless
MPLSEHIPQNFVFVMFKDPTLVARSVIASKKADALERPNVAGGKGSGVVGSLTSILKKEKQKLHAVSSSRHSHFGGTLERKKQGGEKKYVTANVNTYNTHGSIGSQLQQTSLASTKKRSKNRTYFVGGSGRSTAIHTRPGAARTASIQIGPAARKAQQVLHAFSIRFMEQCYGPVMKSLKNEFRRESSRLEGEDKVIFFRILWFFSQWWRTSCEEGSMAAMYSSKVDENIHVDPAKSSIGQLIFTMDVFTFNLVLNSTDFFNEHKQFKNLSQAVALYVEMIHLLYTMYKSDDSTEHLMAMGLMDRLFYQQDPIDRLPALLSKWDHGTFTRDYLCDLIELTHLTLKLLDTNAKACESFRDDNLKKRLRKDDQPKDAITRMKSYAADFEVTVYLARKIISSKTISMFTQLLSQYDINATNINDHIIGFFHRISRFVVASDNDDEFYGDNIDEKLSDKNVTLEPMLFNIQLMGVLNEILNDSDVRKDQSFTGVLSFASQFVRHFAKATEKNPMLFVEALFSHQFPHRHVERCSSVYVSEELKMLAARDMLIEQTGRELQEESDEKHEKAEIIKENKSVREDEDGEDEMEFVESVEAKIDQFPKKSDSSHAPSKRNTDINNRSKGTLADNNADDSIERELDEDENRWNDRRSFVPKRKIADSSTKSADKDTAEESVESITKDVSEQIDSPQKRARVNHLEDSDDEEELNVAPLKRSLPKGKARQLLEDSDEED